MCVLTAVWSMDESVPIVFRPPPRCMATRWATWLTRQTRLAVWSVVYADVTVACSEAYSQLGYSVVTVGR